MHYEDMKNCLKKKKHQSYQDWIVKQMENVVLVDIKSKG